MRLLSSRILWGVLLIAGGAIFLLQNLGLIEFGSLFAALLFVFGSAVFFSIFLNNREHWWALIPAFLLLGLAAQVSLAYLAPQLTALVGGGLFLGMLGLAFFAIYLNDRHNWWAAIPGGVLLTLAAVSALGESPLNTGALFFFGLGLTFAIVAVLPTPDGAMRWAFIPAGILLLISFLLLIAAGDYINLALPLALIAAGLYLLLRAFIPRWRM
jgi:hypothetical protein